MTAKQKIIRRLLAFMLDYLIIAVYGTILFGVTMLLGGDELGLSWLPAQALAFATLTLPVFLYFYVSERSKHHGTVGKRIMKMQVVPSSVEEPHYFRRNFLKFIAWEIAHTGIHAIFHYDRVGEEPPAWAWVLLLLPYVFLFAHAGSILLSKGNGSWYDNRAKTKIVFREKSAK